MSSESRTTTLIVAAVIAAAVAYWWWSGQPPAEVTPAPEPAAATTPAPEADATAAASGAVTAEGPAEPEIEHELPAPDAESESEAPMEAPAAIGPALAELVSPKVANALLQVGDFPRRFVATVDNLGRSYAPASVWPVNPAPDRFEVQPEDSTTVIAGDNSARYAPLMKLADSIDPATAVDLYIRMYPLLQQAYEDLGFPGRYFNDRLIQVIDLLLASPEPSGPVAVTLTEVKGPEPSLRPWVRYEFADPALQSLTAGQKIMVRVGPDNERRLKAKLAALRAELVGRSVSR